MIGKLTGRFDGTTPDGSAVIDVNAVGYVVRTTLSAVVSMQSGYGERVSLYIHTAVRDDAIDLFGFLTEPELSFFKLLMSVSGIGPKTALGVLNVADITSLKRSIAKGDAAALTKVFGIGKKSAERIVVELRDKVSIESDANDLGIADGSDGEVIEALMALGYSAQEARGAIKATAKVASASENVLTVQQKIATALKHLGSRATT